MKIVLIYLSNRKKPIQIEYDKDEKLSMLASLLNGQDEYIQFGPIIFRRQDFIRLEMEEV